MVGKVRSNPWTPEDIKLLKTGVATVGRKWGIVSSKFVPNHTAAECKGIWYRQNFHRDPATTQSHNFTALPRNYKWKQETEKLLVLGILEFGTQFDKISAKIPGTNERCCKDKWYKILKKHFTEEEKSKIQCLSFPLCENEIICNDDPLEFIKKVCTKTTSLVSCELDKAVGTKWTMEENEILVRGVLTYGFDWEKIAREVRTRNWSKCKDHWIYLLNPKTEQSVFTPDDAMRLLRMRFPLMPDQIPKLYMGSWIDLAKSLAIEAATSLNSKELDVFIQSLLSIDV